MGGLAGQLCTSKTAHARTHGCMHACSYVYGADLHIKAAPVEHANTPPDRAQTTEALRQLGRAIPKVRVRVWVWVRARVKARGEGYG